MKTSTSGGSSASAETGKSEKEEKEPVQIFSPTIKALKQKIRELARERAKLVQTSYFDCLGRRITRSKQAKTRICRKRGLPKCVCI